MGMHYIAEKWLIHAQGLCIHVKTWQGDAIYPLFFLTWCNRTLLQGMSWCERMNCVKWQTLSSAWATPRWLYLCCHYQYPMPSAMDGPWKHWKPHILNRLWCLVLWNLAVGDVLPRLAALPEHGEFWVCSQGGSGILTAPPTKQPLNCAQGNAIMLAPKPYQETKLPSHLNSLVN